MWPLLPLLGSVQSIGLGGEIKSVRRTRLYGILGALVATGLVIAAFGARTLFEKRDPRLTGE